MYLCTFPFAWKRKEMRNGDFNPRSSWLWRFDRLLSIIEILAQSIIASAVLVVDPNRAKKPCNAKNCPLFSMTADSLATTAVLLRNGPGTLGRKLIGTSRSPVALVKASIRFTSTLGDKFPRRDSMSRIELTLVPTCAASPFLAESNLLSYLSEVVL